MRPLEPAEQPAHDIDVPFDIRADALAALLEPLPYPLRMRALALHARRLAGTPRLRVLLDELSGQDRYARRTALHLAMAARDLGHIERVLAGPDLELRRAALRAARTLPVPDAAVAAALRDAPTRLRLALYRTLAHSCRRALAEALLPEVRARWGDREAAALLPACGPATVARGLPEVAHAVTSWRALAKRHPGAVMAVAEDELSRGVHALTWWRRRGTGVELAAPAEPERMLALLERYDLRRAAGELPAPALNALFRADAGRARALLVDASLIRWQEPPKALLRHLRSAPDAEVLRLASAEDRIGPVLRSLPPARRGAVFQAVAARRGGSTGLWGLRLLRWLRADMAAAEARRMLAWYGSVWHSARRRLDNPDIPLTITSYLPYEEAAGPLREAAVGGDPRRRGLARSLLIRCAARTRDRAVFRTLLTELVPRVANEQDPLRRDLLTALLEVSPALFDDSCAATLERLAADVAGASDSSPATGEALRCLAGRVLRHHDPAVAPALTAWALGAYGKLVARHGAAALPAPERVPRRPWEDSDVPPDSFRLDRVLRTGQEHDLLTVLRPHLRAARERADFAPAVALARALGRRAWALGELQEDLRAAIGAAPEPLAREAADLWLTRPRARRRPATPAPPPDQVLPPSGGERDPQAQVPPSSRGERDPQPQDPPLSREVPGPRAIPLTTQRPARQGETQGPPPSRAEPESPTVPLTAVDPAEERVERVVRLLREDPSVVTLPAVWRTVAGRRTDLLVALLDGDRDGRFADPAWVPPTGGGDAGRWTPHQLGRVRARLVAVVHDERLPMAARAAAVRATGRARGDLDLLERWAQREETPLAEAAVTTMADTDAPVRALPVIAAHAGGHASRVAVAALARCCRGVPPSLRHSGEAMLRTLFQAHPMEYAPAARPRYADLVRRLLLAADAPGVGFRGRKAFGLWARWYEGDLDEIADTVADPGADERVVEVFLALLDAGTIRSRTLGVLERLAAAVPGEVVETPARERVGVIVRRLAATQEEAEPWQRRLAQDAMDLLAAHPPLLGEAARLAVALLAADSAGADSSEDDYEGFADEEDSPYAEVAAYAEVSTHEEVAAHEDGRAAALGDALCALADLLRDRPLLAARTAGRVTSALLYEYGRGRPMPPATALPAARRLADRGDLSGALFALELTRAFGGRTGWATPWREVLLGLRACPHLEVRQEAWDVSLSVAQNI
ncbi:hypothetical protein [Nonomuraea roseoviolacea]|uniref:HEAT repeat domain-containing protein n=1 Tax=Nonomuraea roseoviolacea subsp. carminata TaxID=160689 RepID=A0ABT1KBP4_9ACTN|nr:hypothetical protein [Nonomuraea roseoviolacea]MCP2351370.1 hypothetical protein [Nonomuraea roseoviolacea subsp. carminata]